MLNAGIDMSVAERYQGAITVDAHQRWVQPANC